METSDLIAGLALAVSALAVWIAWRSHKASVTAPARSRLAADRAMIRDQLAAVVKACDATKDSLGRGELLSDEPESIRAASATLDRLEGSLPESNSIVLDKAILFGLISAWTLIGSPRGDVKRTLSRVRKFEDDVTRAKESDNVLTRRERNVAEECLPTARQERDEALRRYDAALLDFRESLKQGESHLKSRVKQMDDIVRKEAAAADKY